MVISMRIPKRYGQSKLEICPFCEKQATTKNKEDIPVCFDHKEERFPELKCQCGDYLEQRSGKYGIYFNCMKCGNINYRKALSLNPKIEAKKVSTEHTQVENQEMAYSQTTVSTNHPSNLNQQNKNSKNKEKKEITISTNDARYFS